MVLGPRQNIIILKILSESKRNDLKYSLKIIVMHVPLDNREVTSFNLKYFAFDSKKATVLDGPWSVIHVKSTKGTRECDSFPTKM